MPTDAKPSREWLVVESEMASLIRAKDWSKTPLGPRAEWPPSLKMAVSLSLESTFPTCLTWGPQMLFLYNDACRIIAADKHPAVLGLPVQEAFAEVWHLTRPIFTAVMEEGKALFFEEANFPIKRKGRIEDSYFTLGYQPVRREDGSVGGVLLTFLETTAARADRLNLAASKERSRRQLAELGLIYDSAPVGLCVVDRDLRFLRVNRRLAEINGVPAEEHVGKTVEEVVPRLAATARECAARVLGTGAGLADVEVRDAAGAGPGAERVRREQWLPLKDSTGAIIGISIVVEDISERVRAEEALREADRRKNEFLMMLSHELRNPLATIGSSLYLLEHSSNGEQATARSALTVIERQARHLTSLVDDLLDVSRITRGKVVLRRRRLDLRELVRVTVDDHRAVFAEAGVGLELAAGPEAIWVEGDRTRLAQVLGNLLQNSAKFTRAGGRTTVMLRVDEGRGCAVLRVHDTGRGMGPDVLKRIFEPFMQADVTLDRRLGGLGLGLALVKGLVEMHGGSVEVASGGPGKGATFSVFLPLSDSASEEKVQRAVEAEALPRRILVVEDHPEAAQNLGKILSLRGHQVELAFDGREALAKAGSFRPEVVICDIGLPEMDGYAVARAVRADPALAGVTLIALTGYAAPEDMARSKEAGFDAHFGKPPSLESLLEMLSVPRPAAPAR